MNWIEVALDTFVSQKKYFAPKLETIYEAKITEAIEREKKKDKGSQSRKVKEPSGGTGRKSIEFLNSNNLVLTFASCLSENNFSLFEEGITFLSK